MRPWICASLAWSSLPNTADSPAMSSFFSCAYSPGFYASRSRLSHTYAFTTLLTGASSRKC